MHVDVCDVIDHFFHPQFTRLVAGLPAKATPGPGPRAPARGGPTAAPAQPNPFSKLVSPPVPGRARVYKASSHSSGHVSSRFQQLTGHLPSQPSSSLPAGELAGERRRTQARVGSTTAGRARSHAREGGERRAVVDDDHQAAAPRGGRRRRHRRRRGLRAGGHRLSVRRAARFVTYTTRSRHRDHHTSPHGH